ncbi:hypothetical protein [Actinoplanes sp. NPDC049681]|uniref:hypothetical protein n=1 Tax=Actinoplanes sp. NPDC049681 TaxID=3363905 RepID=UPI0037AEC3DF
MRAILYGKIGHDGDLALKRHVLNPHRRVNQHGVSFGKAGGRESPRKVDLYAALMLAHEALYDYRTRGRKDRPRTGRGYFI